LSRVYCQLWVSHPYLYPYPRKFSCSCMGLVDRFFLGIGYIFEPVYSNRFLFRKPFKVNKKNINKRFEINVKFEVFLGKLVPKLFL
jgi:hypothetical protein